MKAVVCEAWGEPSLLQVKDMPLPAPGPGQVRDGHAASEAEIIQWAHTHMAAYKVPHAIEFRAALPRSGTGKVQWRALQDDEDRRAQGDD